MLSDPNKVTVPLLSGIYQPGAASTILSIPLKWSAIMNESLCACGCGAQTWNGRRFVRGHHMRTAEARERNSLIHALDGPSVDFTGKRFAKLLVIEWGGWRQYAKGRESTWKCQCDCGNQAVVPQRNLVGGNTKSCGCIIGQHKRTHGGTGTPEFRIWDGMRRRCSDPAHVSFKDYGERGIRVCERWLHSFENFLADMGPRPSPAHSIDRKDNDGHYEPGNCRWATRREQSNNRRSNRRLTIQGVTKTYAEWEHDAGLKPGTVFVRLSKGWQGADVLLPSMRKKGASRVHPMRKRPVRYLGEQHE